MPPFQTQAQRVPATQARSRFLERIYIHLRDEPTFVPQLNYISKDLCAWFW